MPTHRIVSVWLVKVSDTITFSESIILLTDFGEVSSFLIQSKYYLYMSFVNRSSEVRFESDNLLSFLSDTWSLVCEIWSMIAERLLFEGWIVTEDYMIREYVDALGILLLKWWRSWDV